MRHLVVQGFDADQVALKTLAKLAGAQGIEQITLEAFRLLACNDKALESQHDEIAATARAASLDWAIVPAARQRSDFGLFVTDMDSTLINIECIDEVADFHGVKAEVAAITEASMRGELDFTAALTRRVALLAGLAESALAEVYAQRLRLNPGAERLLAHLKRSGIRTMLVSGGFTFFTERLRAQLGFDHAHANALEVRDGKLTGGLAGPIVDAAAKARLLREVRDAARLPVSAVVAIGDGANDVPMLREAGLGIAYRAKPVVREAVDACLDFAALDGVLPLLGSE